MRWIKSLNHLKIVKLGEVTDAEEVYFLMEHVSKGDMFRLSTGLWLHF